MTVDYNPVIEQHACDLKKGTTLQDTIFRRD
jgi:hypothetical protein